MTDSEKIALLIQDKHLTNAQFCAATDLQPAALSHITSGRSKPSLSILRSIAKGFPDVNPMWLFGEEEEEMYRSSSSKGSVSPTPSEEASGVATPTAADTPKEGELFAHEDTPDDAQPANIASTQSTNVPSEPAAPTTQPAALASGAAHTPAATTNTVIIQQVPTPEPPRRRNIVEIRVFYDDNTFEILTRKP